jgi:hypothetical protein
LEGEVADEQLCGHHEPPAAIKTECSLSPGSPCGVWGTTPLHTRLLCEALMLTPRVFRIPY